MKVLHLLSSNCFSGAENVACQIIGMFRGEPDMEAVYCSRDGQIREALAARNIPFIPLQAMSADAVKKVLRAEKPDLIHAHDMRAGLTAALVCGKIPMISHIHNNHAQSRRVSVRSVTFLLTAWKAKHIFWVSQSACDGYFFRKWVRGKSRVLQNIIDIDDLYEKVGRDDNTYGYDAVFIGRLVYPKNPRRLIRVLTAAIQKYPALKAAVIGGGEMEPEIRQAAEALGISGNIEFLGYLENPLKILHDAKVMILTSFWEGTPMCALEAMALGVPIVSTPADGLNVLVETDRNGYLSEDDGILAEKITAIVSDAGLYTRLSACARERAQLLNDMEPYRKTILEQYRTSVGSNL